MSAFVDWLGAAGAWIVVAALSLSLLLVCIAVKDFFDRRYRSELPGALAALLAFVLLALLFGGAVDALLERACRTAADYAACMEGD